MKRLKLDRPLIVEGRYDKSKLASFLDGVIITTGGFDIFRDHKRLEMIRTLAKEKGIIILTDSDVAGFRIRSYLKGAIPQERIINAYIPDVYGKEKRKAVPSKEGKLGVEGIDAGVLIDVLRRAGVLFEDEEQTAQEGERLTKLDLYELGLSGGMDSAAKRRKLLHRLGLPENMAQNSMVGVLGAQYTAGELKEILKELD